MNVKKLKDYISNESNTIKNYNKLCEILEIVPSGGNSKKAVLKILDDQFEYYNMGQKIIFTKIKQSEMNGGKPYQIVSNNRYRKSDNKKITEILGKLIVFDLHNMKNNNGVIIGSSNQMLFNLSMVNDRYKIAVNNPKQISEQLGLELQLTYEWFEKTQNKLINDFKKSLNYIERNGWAKWYKINIVSVRDEETGFYTHREATVDEEKYRMECTKMAFDLLEVKEFKEIIYKKKYKQFIDLMNKIHSELLPSREWGLDEHVEYFYEGFKIVYNQDVIDKLINDSDSDMDKITINEIKQLQLLDNLKQRKKSQEKSLNQKYDYREKSTYIEQGVILINEFVAKNNNRVIVVDEEITKKYQLKKQKGKDSNGKRSS